VAVITVQTKAAGSSRPIVPEFELPPPDDQRQGSSPATLRDLIARTVRHEVDAFRGRQLDNRFLRALSREQIEAAVEIGAVRSGGVDLEQELDVDDAVSTALQAFEDGLYYVFVDRAQCHSLDEQVQLTENSAVLFLRLVPLAGG
jgi:hypothetical protein